MFWASVRNPLKQKKTLHFLDNLRMAKRLECYITICWKVNDECYTIYITWRSFNLIKRSLKDIFELKQSLNDVLCALRSANDIAISQNFFTILRSFWRQRIGSTKCEQKYLITLIIRHSHTQYDWKKFCKCQRWIMRTRQAKRTKS